MRKKKKSMMLIISIQLQNNVLKMGPSYMLSWPDTKKVTATPNAVAIAPVTGDCQGGKASINLIFQDQSNLQLQGLSLFVIDLPSLI